MKKLTFLAIVLAFMSACQKEPVADRDGRYLVHTARAMNVAFGSYGVFNLPDSILVLREKREPSYSHSENAKALIQQVRLNMEKRGYVFSADSRDADIGLRLTYMVKAGVFPANSLTVDMLDLATAKRWAGEAWPVPEEGHSLAHDHGSDGLKVIWSSYSYGIASPSVQYDLARLKQAIDQAFAQSPYLKAEKGEQGLE